MLFTRTMKNVESIAVRISSFKFTYFRYIRANKRRKVRHTVQYVLLSTQRLICGFVILPLCKNVLSLYEGLVSLLLFLGMLGTPNMVPYSATKFALTGFMEGLHYELKNDKVSKYFRTLLDHMPVVVSVFPSSAMMFIDSI